MTIRERLQRAMDEERRVKAEIRKLKAEIHVLDRKLHDQKHGVANER